MLIAHNVTTELLRQIEAGGGLYGPFRRELVATWRCFYPPAFERAALEAVLQRAGWSLREVTTRARIAAEACGRGRSGGGSGDGGGGGSSTGGAADKAAATAGSSDLAGRVDFEARPEQGEDRFAVFFTAVRTAAS